eukprot:gene10959-3667_t
MDENGDDLLLQDVDDDISSKYSNKSEFSTELLEKLIPKPSHKKKTKTQKVLISLFGAICTFYYLFCTIGIILLVTLLIIYGNLIFILNSYVSIHKDSFNQQLLRIDSNRINMRTNVSYNVLFRSKGHIYLDNFRLEIFYKKFKLFEEERKINKFIQRTFSPYDGFKTSIEISNKLIGPEIANEIEYEMKRKGSIELSINGKVYVQYGIVFSCFPKIFKFNELVNANITK